MMGQGFVSAKSSRGLYMSGLFCGSITNVLTK